ncbi:MAG: transcriptional regulator [Verrucomicrobia bacterium]|nr:transcriptional regulator [Verrucomicrobiota bacterium]|tara:strand:- start:241 stop:588 length:348 start_codon:yes stop_codon:yes gene_type:complete
MSVDFNNRMTQVRKDKNLSREQLGKLIGTSGAIIGRYERGDMKPSIEIAAKIAEALEVSLDYLVGSAAVVVKDKKMLYRLELLEKISEDDKNTILKVVDSYLKEAQLSSTQSKLM